MHGGDLTFHDGNRILLCTDGVTETRNGEGTSHPPAERLAE
jgi:hypothetical protein